MTIYDEIIADNPSGYWDFQSLSGTQASDNSFYGNTAEVGGDLVQYPQAAASYKSIELGPGNMVDPSAAGISGDMYWAATYWVPGNCTLIATNAKAKTGSYSIKATYSGSGSYMQLYSQGSGAGGIPVIPGKQYTSKFSCLADTNTRSCYAALYWYKSDGTASSTSSNAGAAATNSSSVWTDYTCTATAPADAAYGIALLYISSPTAGDIFYVDDAGFFQGAVTDYAYPSDNIITYCERKTENLMSSAHASASSTSGLTLSGATITASGGEYTLTATGSALMYTYVTGDIPVTPGKMYTASINVTQNNSRIIYVGMQFLEGSRNYQTLGSSSLPQSLPAGYVGRVHVTSIAPPGTTHVRVLMPYAGTGSTSDVVKFNQLSLVENTLVDFALPGTTDFTPVNSTEYPVRSWNKVSDGKPFVFECTFRPESYESSIALYESYKNYSKASSYTFALVNGSNILTTVSTDYIFPGTQIYSSAGLIQGATVNRVMKSTFTVTTATRDATTITYTCPDHPFTVGQIVNVSGMTPTSYNISLPVTSTTTDTFTVTRTQSYAACTAGGTATLIQAELSRSASSNQTSAAAVYKQTNNSGIYYEDGQLVVKLCGRTKQWEYFEDKVVYNVPEIASYHLVVRINSGQVDIYLDGTLVKSSPISVPDYFDAIDGYRTRQIHGKTWISNVAVYNSDVKIDLIKNHAQAQNHPQNNLITYFTDNTTFFDISNDNRTLLDSLDSPSKTSWDSYTLTNVNTDGKTIGLQRYERAVATQPLDITYGVTTATLTATGIQWDSIAKIIDGDFAVTGTFKFSGYTQGSDSFDGQKFYVYDFESASARLSVYRELRDVSGTLKSYLVLSYTSNNVTLTESIDYTSYGTSFPSTTAFNIMVKRENNNFVLQSYDIGATTYSSATIVTENTASAINHAKLFIACDINENNFAFATINTIKAINNLNTTDDHTFMTASTIVEACSLPLNITSELRVYQRGSIVTDLISSKFNDDGTRDTNADIARISWEPELSNIVVQTSIDDGANYSAAISSGARIPTFTNNGDALAEITKVRASFETYDSENDVPQLYSLSAEYEDIGQIVSIDNAELLYPYGNYMIAKRNSYPTDCTKNTGLRFENGGGFYYAPDISRDNIITNWSFSSYDNWSTSNGLEELYVDPTLSSGFGFKIPFTTSVTLTGTEKLPVVVGQTYSACIYTKAMASATATLSINWYKDDDTSAGTATTSASHTLTNSITPVYISGTAPANSAYAKISVVFASGTAQDVTVDTAVFNEGASTVPLFVDNNKRSFTSPHQYKTVGMIVRPESGFSQTGTYTLFDYYDGTRRYRINNTSSGLQFTNFNKVYVDGVDTSANTLLPTAGWHNIVGTITGDYAICPQTNRKANFGMTYTNTEYGYWSFDSVWFQKTTATSTTVANDYAQIFGGSPQAVDDVLGSSLLTSEEYRTIITPRTLIPSSQ